MRHLLARGALKLGASQIVIRDLDDGRVEVAVMHVHDSSKSAAMVRWLLSTLDTIVDLRGIGSQLASGRRIASDTVLVMSIGDSITFEEPPPYNSSATGSA